MANLKMKSARAECGFSQQELAEQVGVSRRTISLVESGEHNPTLRLCTDICRALGRTLNELFWAVMQSFFMILI